MEDILDISRYVQSATGVDITSFDKKLLQQKIDGRLSHLTIPSLKEYGSFIKNQKDECTVLLGELGVNVSHFFRNPLVFELINNTVIPEIVEMKRAQNSNTLRIWSAGCSTGEEPYSVAILLHKYFKKEISDWKIQIFATDIQRSNIEFAQQAVYQPDKLTNVKFGLVTDYFEAQGERYQLHSSISTMVHFSLDDLTSTQKIAPADSIFGNFDLVLCRNVLIYFAEKIKLQSLKKLIHSLSDHSYLILGKAEWIPTDMQSYFSDLDQRNCIYRKR